MDVTVPLRSVDRRLRQTKRLGPGPVRRESLDPCSARPAALLHVSRGGAQSSTRQRMPATNSQPRLLAPPRAGDVRVRWWSGSSPQLFGLVVAAVSLAFTYILGGRTYGLRIVQAGAASGQRSPMARRPTSLDLSRSLLH